MIIENRYQRLSPPPCFSRHGKLDNYNLSAIFLDYFHHRALGMTSAEIAAKVFKVR